MIEKSKQASLADVAGTVAAIDLTELLENGAKLLHGTVGRETETERRAAALAEIADTFHTGSETGDVFSPFSREALL